MKLQTRITKLITNRWKNLISLDKIRLLKLLEMFQYTGVYVVLTLIVTIAINKLVEILFFKDKKKKENTKNKPDETLSINTVSYKQDNASKLDTFILFLKYTGILIVQTFIILVAIYYVRKIGLLIPSISHIIYPKFRPSTTIDFSINIAIFMIISQLLPHHTEFIDVVGHFYH